nr:hypothetical protein CFP56_31999 [Quercus suber]
MVCDASILLGLLKKKETMVLLYMLSIRFVTCLSRQAVTISDMYQEAEEKSWDNVQGLLGGVVFQFN